MQSGHPRARGFSAGFGAVLLAAALLAWLAAIAYEGSTPRASLWSAPWIGAYGLAIASALVNRGGLRGVAGYLSGAALFLSATGALIRTTFPPPKPPATGVLTGADIPFLVALGLLCLAVVFRTEALRERRLRSDLQINVGGGFLLLWGITLLTDYVSHPNMWRGPEFYIISAVAVPPVLAFVATASPGKWSATTAAAGYTALALAAIWGFQALPLTALAPDDPGLGHLLPPPFPLVLMGPALIIDVILGRSRRVLRPWARVAAVTAAGLAFVVVMAVVHWPLADLLLSPVGRIAAFGADQWPFYAEAGDWQYQYWTLAPGTRALAGGFVIAGALSTCSVGIGHLLGRWTASAR